MTSRWVFTLAFALLTALMLYPAVRTPARDSWPLSNFPMFARPRDGTVQAVWVRATGPNGNPLATLTPKQATGISEVLQARRFLFTLAARAPLSERQAFCQEVRDRNAARLPGDAVLEVVWARFNALDYFSGDTAPEAQKVIHRCADAPRAAEARRG